MHFADNASFNARVNLPSSITSVANTGLLNIINEENIFRLVTFI